MTDSDRSDCDHPNTVHNEYWKCKYCGDILGGEQAKAVPIQELEDLVDEMEDKGHRTSDNAEKSGWFLAAERLKETIADYGDTDE